MAEELPAKSAKVALVLVAILAIAGTIGMMIHLNGLGGGPTTQPSTQAPGDNTKEP